MNSIEAYVGNGGKSIPAARLSKASIAVVMGLLGISYIFNARDRQVFPALLGGVQETYGLTLAQAGFVSTVFTINAAILGALNGWFLARFTRKSILVGGLASYSLFTVVTPLAQRFVSLAFYRAITGVGEALQIGPIFACVGCYFGKSRGTAMGLMQAFFGFGTLAGPVVGTHLGHALGSWQGAFYVFGIGGISIAAGVALFVPSAFTEATEGSDHTSHADKATPSEQSWVLNRNVCLASAAFALIGWSFFSYSALYATFLREHLGYTPVAAGSALGMYGLGAMGAAIGGWAGDRLGRPGIFVCLVILATVSFCLFNGAELPAVHRILSFVFGPMVSGYFYTQFISIVQRSARPNQIGYAVAATMTGFYLSGPFAGYLFGKLVEAWGWSSAANIAIVAPPCLAIVLMRFFDFNQLRNA